MLIDLMCSKQCESRDDDLHCILSKASLEDLDTLCSRVSVLLISLHTGQIQEDLLTLVWGWEEAFSRQ